MLLGVRRNPQQTQIMTTHETPGHPTRILRDGYAQAVRHNAPLETILRLKIAIYEQALNDIAQTGGHQGIVAKTALVDATETDK